MLPSASQSTPSPTGEINVLPSIITGVLEALNLYVLNLELYNFVSHGKSISHICYSVIMSLILLFSLMTQQSYTIKTNPPRLLTLADADCLIIRQFDV